MKEQEALAGVAVDAVFDSVSVATTFKAAGRNGHHLLLLLGSGARASRPGAQVPGLGGSLHRQLLRRAQLRGVQRRLVLLRAQGRHLPHGASTYFRINAKDTGQFERTLIVADEGAYVSYLEGCTAPMRDENQLHAAVVELVALDNASIKYSTVQNWYPGDKDGKGGIYNFVTKRGACRA
jgi:Fe-S cluster assembly protein SufB